MPQIRHVQAMLGRISRLVAVVQDLFQDLSRHFQDLFQDLSRHFQETLSLHENQCFWTFRICRRTFRICHAYFQTPKMLFRHLGTCSGFVAAFSGFVSGFVAAFSGLVQDVSQGIFYYKVWICEGGQRFARARIAVATIACIGRNRRGLRSRKNMDVGDHASL